MTGKGRVLLGMSGGVDSSAAAVLLQRAGYEVAGCTLLLFDREAPGLPGESGRRSTEGVEAARAAADRLEMEHFVFSFTDLFRREVLEPFAAEYAAGRTPNPCIQCNRRVKFTALLRQADEMGFDYIATGHYARVSPGEAGGRCRLLRGRDRAKDQSYFLYPLSQEILGRLLLPLGEYEKEQARILAAEAGLANAGRPDSQDICFVPDGDYMAFLTRFGLVPREGDFVDRQGRVLGRHRGQEAYTLGQRRGLGISAPQPLYVLGKDPAGNRVILGENAALFSPGLVAGQFQWVSVPAPAGEIPVEARIRHTPRAAAAFARPLPDGRVEVRFARAQRAVTPGQSVVLYRGDLVLGGGVIQAVEPE